MGKFKELAIDIQEYEKTDVQRVPMTSTSVWLRKTQLKFVQEKNLNLSKIVRDVIESLIKQERKK